MPRPCSPRAGFTTSWPSSASSSWSPSSKVAVLPRGTLRPAAGDDLAGDALVVASAHGDRRGQLGERFAGDDAAAAVRELQVARVGVEHGHADPSPQRLVGDDPRVGVAVLEVVGHVPGEERLVDGVLALHGEHRDPLEAELLVEQHRRPVVVHHGEVEVGPAPGLVALQQRPGQRFADVGQVAGGVDGEAPQARTALRVGEEALVIDAGHRADDLARVGLRDQHVHGAVLQLVVPQRLDGSGHHAAAQVDAVDLLAVLGVGDVAHHHARDGIAPWPVGVQVRCGRCSTGRRRGPAAFVPRGRAGRAGRAQMSRRPSVSSRRMRSIDTWSAKVWPKISRPQPISRTTLSRMGSVRCSGGRSHDVVVMASRRAHPCGWGGAGGTGGVRSPAISRSRRRGAGATARAGRAARAGCRAAA